MSVRATGPDETVELLSPVEPSEVDVAPSDAEISRPPPKRIVFGTAMAGITLLASASYFWCSATKGQLGQSAARKHRSVVSPRNNIREVEDRNLVAPGGGNLKAMIEAKIKVAENRGPLPKNVHNVLKPLGRGFCTDRYVKYFDGLDKEDGASWDAATVDSDGRSLDCEKECLEDSKCKGYATYSTNKCGIIRSGYPAWADGEGDGHCFFKQDFFLNSTDLYKGIQPPVPKILWSFWQNMGARAGRADLPPFVDLCVSSWKHLNPDWTVRVLNESSKFDWLDKSDLPENYDEQDIIHKSDAVRFAVLDKHGGVWMDATILLLKPFSQFIPSSARNRTFMHTHRDTGRRKNRTDRAEGRVGTNDYIESWFLVSPPGDPLFHRTRKCIGPLRESLDQWATQPFLKRFVDGFVWSGMFTPRLAEELKGIRIWDYLSVHACFLKTIDEDAAIYDWYHKSNFNHLDTIQAAYRMQGWDDAETRMFKSIDNDMFTDLTNPASKMIKWRSIDRHAVMAMSKEELWCKPSTLHLIITSIGLQNMELCSRSSNAESDLSKPLLS